MSSITNINNNSSVVNVGRTTPVSPGQQPASKSIPVVLATDQTAVPVIEQNKIQSEVALSLLGIPRAEVALGIFADVNTYDVNPTEWSKSPEQHVGGTDGVGAWGTKHLPNEAGALVEAPRNENAVLTSKRFFRYQPGRVSAATFGIRSSVSNGTFRDTSDTTSPIDSYAQNPSVRKYGIYDNYDGYYWETRQNGEGDNFTVVRRTQSVFRHPATPFGVGGITSLRGTAYDESAPTDTAPITQLEDYRIVGKPHTNTAFLDGGNFIRDRENLKASRFAIVDAAYATILASDPNYFVDLANALSAAGSSETAASVEAKCKRDADYWMDMFLMDMSWDIDAHTKVNLLNFLTAVLVNNGAAELEFYDELSAEITANGESTYGLTSAAVTKLTNLIAIIRNQYSNASGPLLDSNYGTYAVRAQAIVGSLATGTKNLVDVVYDARKHYWAYYVSVYKELDVFNAGNTGTTPYGSGTKFGGIFDASGYTVPSGYGLTAEDIKYKCQRDQGYLIDGFKNDIVGGGDGETKYNMSMFVKWGSSNTLTIYSQTETDGSPVEIQRSTDVKSMILFDLNQIFGYSTSSAVFTKQANLSDRVIANYTTEDAKDIEEGERGFAGNLAVLRDGLVLTHAAMYDPALLKEKKRILTEVTSNGASAGTFRLTEDVVTYGQHVKYFGSTNGDLVDGTLYKVYRVIGPKGNEFQLRDEDGNDIVAASSGTGYFQLVNPFIFPNVYNPEVYRAGTPVAGQDLGGVINGDGTDAAAIAEAVDDPFPVGMMFPYMYASDENLTSNSDPNQVKVGFINTALIEGEDDDTWVKRTGTQIDHVNFVPEYINWIKNNVKPEFWGVYEYRVPRSRYSHDKLDGKSGAGAASKLVYSDKATAPDGTVARPGEKFQEVPGVDIYSESEYDYDFTKVTMLKIEFSWYGAVGALFLAYIPVDNGEARWVRVHHLRASNQLKIASLGNATLPITYTVYGGGDYKSLGDGQDDSSTGETPFTNAGYGNSSHHIVKYGASYYIDGGDRGTIRLYSYNNENAIDARGKQFTYTPVTDPQDYEGSAFFEIAESALGGIDPRFFMGSNIKINGRVRSNVLISWVEKSGTDIKFYINGTLPAIVGDITFIPDRSTTLYGLQTKQFIKSAIDGNSVRNRVQVYPTKMSTANLGTHPVRLRMKKTPLFQSDIISSDYVLPGVTATGTQKSLTLLLVNGEEYKVTSANAPLSINESTAFLENGESLFGWFRGKVDSVQETIFGRLYKEADLYYFELRESYSGVVTLDADLFLPDLKFNDDGTAYTDTVNESEREGLSSIIIRENTPVPIPRTGINIATVYLTAGTEQLDLSPYFDYNKEYLSFPLTNQADSLYFVVDTDNPSTTTDAVSLGITWEEQ